MAETVWLVTKGDYDDYHVITAFTTRELAEEHAAAIDGEVAAFDLYAAPPTQTLVYYRHGYVQPGGRLAGDYAYSQLEWEYAVAPFRPVMYARTTNWTVYAAGTDLDAMTTAYARQVVKTQARREAAQRKEAAVCATTNRAR